MCWMAAIPIAMAGAQAISGQATEANVLALRLTLVAVKRWSC